jgi:hypothetical protein
VLRNERREMIGPYYDPGDSPTTCYPVFFGVPAGADVALPPVLDIMCHYEEPLECTMFMIEDSSIIQQSTVQNGKVVPACQLPSLSPIFHN